MSGRIHHNADGSVVVMADNGQQKTYSKAAFQGKEAACVAATGDGITPPTPAYVSRAQLKVAIKRWRKSTEVQAAILTADAETQIVWAEAPNMMRGSAAVADVLRAAGLADKQIDQMFREAESIEV